LADPGIFSDVDNVLIIGDLNSYDKEDPIDTIKAGPDDTLGTGDDYVDLIHHILGEDAYGYVFDGHTGYLDYALANKNLEGFVKDVTIWHINADEPDLIDYDMSYKKPAQDALYAPDKYRSSDHDPVIISLSFSGTAPTAAADFYNTDENVPLEVASPGVLANDNDPDGAPLTAVLDTDVSSGTLILNLEGSFTYTPSEGFNGTDSFTYKAFDSALYSEAVTVTITVNPIYDVFLPIIIN